VRRLVALRTMDNESLRKDFNHRWSLPVVQKFLRTTSRDTLYTFSMALGGKRIANVLEAIIKNPHVYYRGFPDLAFWKCDNNTITSSVKIEADDDSTTMMVNTNTNIHNNDDITMHTSYNYQRKHCCDTNTNTNTPWTSDSFFAVEVKSENDKLSKYQEVVLEMLYDAGIHIEVLKVKYSNEKNV